jgi:hypothetical protein
MQGASRRKTLTSASALLVRFSKRRQAGDCLGLCVDRLAVACWVLAAIRNQAPPQKIERTLAGFVVLADDQLLAAALRARGRAEQADTIARHLSERDAGRRALLSLG